MDETTFLKCACPHCDGHIEYPATAAGQTVACPYCGTTEVLPAAVNAPDRKKRSPFALIGMVGGGMLAVGMVGGLILHQIGAQKSSGDSHRPENSADRKPGNRTRISTRPNGSKVAR